MEKLKEKLPDTYSLIKNLEAGNNTMLPIKDKVLPDWFKANEGHTRFSK